MRTTDSQGRPMRYVPRQPDPFRDPAPHAMAPLPDPMEGLRPAGFAPLPAAASDEESLYRLVNAMRALLVAAGVPEEE
jgi:hypothetical protein